MPYDDRLRLALGAIAPQIATYRAVVTTALERIRATLSAGGGAERARMELGPLGNSRIDAARFAELSRGTVVDGATRQILERAAEILSEMSGLDDAGFVISVPGDDDVGALIDAALAHFGRAFAAMRASDLARAGAMDDAKRELASRRGFDRWTTAERAAAPPLVAIADGGSLNAGELVAVMDGSLHLVLIIDGACQPAALVRLITPGTFVLQTTDERGLKALSASAGPAVAALVDERAAGFVHDPARGPTSWQRMEVWRQAEPQRRRIGGFTIRQQREDVAQLMALATPPSLSSSPLGDLLPAGGEQVDRLTDWLLSESGLTGSHQ